MHKWTQLNISPVEEWSVVKQIVVPTPYCAETLRLAHDNPLTGHLGIRKTFDCILYLFLARLKSNVVRYCNLCHFCCVWEAQSDDPSHSIVFCSSCF